MTKVALILALPLTLMAEPSFAQVAHTLDNPDGVSIYLLQEKYSNSIPDFVEMAGNDPAVKASDEFHKQAMQNQIAAQLKAEFASLQSVNTIVVNLYSTFGPYDSDYGEYDFDISNGTFISYQALGQQVQIVFINGNDAQSWSLKPDNAEKVLDMNNQQRNVTLVLTLALENSSPPIYGQPSVLNTKVISYDILGIQSNIKLGHVNVKSSP